MTDEIRVEREDAIATVVLNKPESHNAISLDMYRRIPDEFAALDADPEIKVDRRPRRRHQEFRVRRRHQ